MKTVYINQDEWNITTALRACTARGCAPTLAELATQAAQEIAVTTLTTAGLMARGVLRMDEAGQIRPEDGIYIIFVPNPAPTLDLAGLDEYQRRSRATINPDLAGREQASYHALGLGGEAGEVQERIKKERYHGHDRDPGKMKSELGDLLWYLAQVATDHGLRLSEIAEGNLEKLQGAAGRYRNGFTQQASRERVA
jgi:NTP pyrophosphatase (non-canonical NTP hydrolase)